MKEHNWKLSSIPYLLPQAMFFFLPWNYLDIPVVYAIILLNNSVRSTHTTCLCVNYIQAFGDQILHSSHYVTLSVILGEDVVSEPEEEDKAFP